MTANGKRVRELGAPRCKSEVERRLTYLLERFEAYAAQGGGTLSIETVRSEIAALLQSGAIDYGEVFKECLVLLSDEVWEEKRQNAFGRLIVRDFEENLTRQINPNIESERVPRRAIGPFLNVLAMLLGDKTYKKFYDEARDLRSRLQLETGCVSVWNEFFGHDDATRIKLQVYAAVARQFADFEKRTLWFVQVMNSQLDHQVTVADLEGRPQWVFQKHHFYALMNELFAPMESLLSSKIAVERMEKYLGVDGVEFVRLFLRNVRERLAESQ